MGQMPNNDLKVQIFLRNAVKIFGPVGSAKTSLFWKLTAVSTPDDFKESYLVDLALLLGFLTNKNSCRAADSFIQS